MPYSTCSQSRQSVDELALVPEIQGTTQEIAVEKCRREAELVSFPVLDYFEP